MIGHHTDSSTPTPVLAVFEVSWPFVAPNGNLLIRSADGVTFRVERTMLIYGSAFFRDMLALPQPSDLPGDDVIPWSEPAHVIDLLLRYTYPIPLEDRPAIGSVDDMITLIRAAEKWQFALPLSIYREQVITPKFIEKHAFQVYAFMCEMGFDEEKIAVAPHASKTDPFELSVRPYYKCISALDVLRLVNLRTRPDTKFDDCFAPSHPRLGTSRIILSRPKFCDDPDEDLTVVSVDGTIFHVVKVFLSKASPKLHAEIKDASSTAASPDCTIPPALFWNERASVIMLLLNYIYPEARPKLSNKSLDDIITWTEAAFKWQIDAALYHLRDELSSDSRLKSHALRIYSFACRMGFEEEKKRAVGYAIRTDPLLHRVKGDFQGMAALDLITLVETREDRMQRTKRVVNDLGLPVVSRWCHHTDRWIEGTPRLKKLLSEALATSMCMEALGPTGLMAHATAALYCSECFPDLGGALEIALANTKLRLLNILKY